MFRRAKGIAIEIGKRIILSFVMVKWRQLYYKLTHKLYFVSVRIFKGWALFLKRGKLILVKEATDDITVNFPFGPATP